MSPASTPRSNGRSEHPEPVGTPVHISVLLDRSGSMSSIAGDIVGGFNEFVAEQQANPGTARLSLVQFDSDGPFEVVYDGVDLADLEPFTRADYRPRGNTPLYDAIGRLVERIDNEIVARADKGLPIEDQLVAIITDGFENASHRCTRQQVFELITERRNRAWTFLFLGADPDTFAQGHEIGLSRAETSRWEPTSEGTREMWSSTSQSITGSRSREASGDVTTPQPPQPGPAELETPTPQPEEEPQKPTRYGPGYAVHWIQAKKGREDRECWRPGRLDRIDDQLLHVTFDDGEQVTYWSTTADRVVRFVGGTVEVTEGWHLLRAPIPHGDQLISIATTDLPELVYGTGPPSSYDEGWFYVVPEGDAVHAAEVVDVVTTCQTWGEVRAAASPGLFRELLELSGYGDFESYLEPLLSGRPIPGLEQAAYEEWRSQNADGLPEDDDLFDPDGVSGWACYDYPLAFEAMQRGSLPAHVLDYADTYETTLNGTYSSFPFETAAEVLTALRRRGYVCTEDKALLMRGMDRDRLWLTEGSDDDAADHGDDEAGDDTIEVAGDTPSAGIVTRVNQTPADDQESPYAAALAAAQLVVAREVVAGEKLDERRRKMQRVVDIHAEKLRASGVELAPSEVLEQFAGELDHETTVAFLVEAWFLDAFHPYTLKYGYRRRKAGLRRIAEYLGESPDIVREIVSAIDSAKRSHQKRSWGRLGLIGVGSALILGAGGFVLAPVVGAALGAGAGLTGAAATAHGLALLGGGSLAAGGAGVAGGMWLVAGAGATLGVLGGGGGTALYQLGAAQARGELLKLQVTFKVAVIGKQADLAEAQHYIDRLIGQADELQDVIAVERELNDKNARRVTELEESLEAIEETITWMKHETAEAS